MEIDTSTYDLVPENFEVIQKLIFEEAARLHKEKGITRGRSLLMATDHVAANLLSEPVAPTILDSWIGRQRQSKRKANSKKATRVVEKVKMVPTNKAEPVKASRDDVLYMEDDVFGLFHNQRRGETADRISSWLKPMKVNEIALVPVNSKEEATHLQSQLSRVSTMVWGGRGHYNSTVRVVNGGLHLAIIRIS